MSSDRTEQRSYKAELRSTTKSGERHLVGYAAVFESFSEKIYDFYEIIKRGAFRDAIYTSDIRGLMNHDSNLILGRTSAGTMKVWEDSRGLAFDIKLPDTSYARDLAVSVDRGDISQCSFTFTAGKDRWFVDKQGATKREILEVEKLFDLGPVTFPAYTETTVSARARRMAETYGRGRTGIVGASASNSKAHRNADAERARRELNMLEAQLREEELSRLEDIVRRDKARHLHLRY